MILPCSRSRAFASGFDPRSDPGRPQAAATLEASGLDRGWGAGSSPAICVKTHVTCGSIICVDTHADTILSCSHSTVGRDPSRPARRHLHGSPPAHEQPPTYAKEMFIKLATRLLVSLVAL